MRNRPEGAAACTRFLTSFWALCLIDFNVLLNREVFVDEGLTSELSRAAERRRLE